ncbi:electron transfer flavoprotein subunit beta/FixA family protein [Thermodesulfobacteriota bacterium]
MIGKDGGYMRIVVCVKQIVHTYSRTGMDPERNYQAPEDSLLRVNPYDERAMEMASGLKSVLGGGEIIVVMLGPLLAESELMRCLALGADQVVRIDQADPMDPWRKSSLLAHAIKALEPNLVLCGKESLDTQNGQVGAFMAHHLGLPFVSAITDLTIEESIATVQRSAGKGVREVIECNLPAIFSVDLGVGVTRLPTYEDKKRAQSLPIRELTIEEEMSPPKVYSEGVFPPRPRPKQVPPIDSELDAHDRIHQLFSGSRVEKKGVILEGSRESQVEGMISFLKEYGFLEEKKPDGA